MNFRLTGLEIRQFTHLFEKSDAELAQLNIRRMPAENGFPCRITLEDAAPGESVLLLPFEHQPEATPYRSSGPIYVREGNHQTAILDRILPQMRGRLYSVRAYDQQDNIIDADVTLGQDLEKVIERFFANDAVRYLHAHHARHGCYAFKIGRA